MKVHYIPDDLKAAVLTLSKESIGDFIYTIRDRELAGWEGPRVKAWSDAAQTIDKYADQFKLDLKAPQKSAFKA